MYKDGFDFPARNNFYELEPCATLETCSNVMKLHHRASIINRNKNKTLEPAFEKRVLLLANPYNNLPDFPKIDILGVRVMLLHVFISIPLICTLTEKMYSLIS